MVALQDEETRSLGGPSGQPGPRVVAVWDGGSVTRPLQPRKALVVGRGKECDVPVLDLTVSRKHARVIGPARPGDPMRVEDLGGSSGVRVDGERVTGTRDVWPGQVVEIGRAALLFQDVVTRRQVTSFSGPDQERFIGLIAKSHLPVLIVGEAGGEAELMAQRIHEASSRKEGPFVAAPALSESLLQQARSGTLFIDEVGELPAEGQALLMRILDATDAGVRILAGSSRDLDTLRPDLVYRLSGATVRVPPLRERKHEIVALAEALLAKAARRAGVQPQGIGALAQKALVQHAWPGNVRELRNVIERALVLAEGKPIEPQHLVFEAVPTASLPAEIETLEKERIAKALASVDGNQTKAAALLGISRRALINRLDAYGLPRPRKH